MNIWLLENRVSTKNNRHVHLLNCFFVDE